MNNENFILNYQQRLICCWFTNLQYYVDFIVFFYLIILVLSVTNHVVANSSNFLVAKDAIVVETSSMGRNLCKGINGTLMRMMLVVFLLRLQFLMVRVMRRSKSQASLYFGLEINGRVMTVLISKIEHYHPHQERASFLHQEILYSKYYFFLNKEMKEIFFFCCELKTEFFLSGSSILTSQSLDMSNNFSDVKKAQVWWIS